MSENVVNSMPINVASLARRSRLRRGDRIIRRIRGRRRASAARLAHREATAENARSSAKDGGPDDHAQRFPPRYPSWYKADRDLARQIVKIQNEKLAEACAANPERFVAFATVALQHPDLAAEQLEEGVKKYGLRGAGIGGNVNGEEISDPKFHPFWAKVEQLGVVVFIHPQGDGAPAQLQQRFKGNGYLGNVIGNPLETTIALSHLIFEGTLDKFPGLKICAAHAGGFLPSYSGRSDFGCPTRPDLKLLHLFNLAVPANEFVNLAELGTEGELDDYRRIQREGAERDALHEFGWLPTRHGALVKTLPVHEPNDLYETTFRLFTLQSPLRMGKTRHAVELLSDARFVDLEANLRYFRDRYSAIIARCQEPGEALATVRGTPYRRVERLHCEYVTAQRDDVDGMLKRLEQAKRSPE